MPRRCQVPKGSVPYFRSSSGLLQGSYRIQPRLVDTLEDASSAPAGGRTSSCSYAFLPSLVLLKVILIPYGVNPLLVTILYFFPASWTANPSL